METLPAIPDRPDFNRMADLVLNQLVSPNSKRSYKTALDGFFAWFQLEPRNFNKAVIGEYKVHLIDKGLAPKTINQRLCVVRSLARELMDSDGLDSNVGNGITRVKGIRNKGTRLGNWLSDDEITAILNAPDVLTLMGLRDTVILACLIGCGLRRDECAKLTEGHFRRIDGQWVIGDLVGKGGRIRSVVAPGRLKDDVDAYVERMRIQLPYATKETPLFCTFNKSGNAVRLGLSPESVYEVVKRYAAMCGFENLAPHDLRRSFAKSSMKHGANLADIQESLGHSSPATTQVYLGTRNNFSETAPGNLIPAMQRKEDTTK